MDEKLCDVRLDAAGVLEIRMLTPLWSRELLAESKRA